MGGLLMGPPGAQGAAGAFALRFSCLFASLAAAARSFSALFFLRLVCTVCE